MRRRSQPMHQRQFHHLTIKKNRWKTNFLGSRLQIHTKTIKLNDNAKGFLLVALLFLLNSCDKKHNQPDSLISLSNGTIEIGLLPEVGGRLVRVSLTGQANIIQSDTTLWNEPSSQRPSLNPLKPFKAYNGEINWVSPQSEWWVKQDSFPDLKRIERLGHPILI